MIEFPDIEQGVLLREASRPDTVWVRTSNTKTLRTTSSPIVQMGNVSVFSHAVLGTRLRAGISIHIDGVKHWQPVSTNGEALAVIAVCVVEDVEFSLHTVWVSNFVRLLKAVPKNSEPASPGNLILAGKRMLYVER